LILNHLQGYTDILLAASDFLLYTAGQIKIYKQISANQGSRQLTARLLDGV